tara:strand:+ start:834 stop:1121 length:288 start_codon:yes stop_codon:yes gene_type:complete
MSEEVWAVIKYKPKEGCEQEFIESLSRLNMSKAMLNRYIKAYNGEIIQIVQSRNIDEVLEGQVAGLEWLDSVSHLLDYYGESRTDAISGIVINDA